MPSNTPQDADRDLAKAQSAVTDPEARLPAGQRAEDKQDGVYVPLTSKRTGVSKNFRLGEEVSFTSMMRWAAAAEDGNGPASLAAYFHVLKDIVHEDDFQEFFKFGDVQRCAYEDYRAFQDAAFEALSGNPTE